MTVELFIVAALDALPLCVTSQSTVHPHTIEQSSLRRPPEFAPPPLYLFYSFSPPPSSLSAINHESFPEADLSFFFQVTRQLRERKKKRSGEGGTKMLLLIFPTGGREEKGLSLSKEED